MLRGSFSLLFYQTPWLPTLRLFILCSKEATVKGHLESLYLPGCKAGFSVNLMYGFFLNSNWMCLTGPC